MVKQPEGDGVGRTDVSSVIDVVREPRSAQVGGAATHRRDWADTGDGDGEITREFGDRLRDAIIRDRVAEAVGQRLESVVRDAALSAIRGRLARELRSAFRDTDTGRIDAGAVTELLSDRLSDAIDQRVTDALYDRFGSVLRDRLATTIRAAMADGAFADRLGQDRVDELIDRFHARAEEAIRERLRGGLRTAVRTRVAEVARDRLGNALRAAAGERRAESDDDNEAFAAGVGQRIEDALHERVVAGVRDRFRSVVASGLHDVTDQRVTEVARAAVRTAAESRIENTRERIATRLDALAESLNRPVAEAIRERLADALRERVTAVLRENVDDVLRDRLVGAIRSAVAEQRTGDGFDATRLAEAIHYQLAEAMRGQIGDALRARASETVRNRLAEAVQTGVARGMIVS